MTAPKRIQRKRTKGWRMPEGAVYVGRPSKWQNIFVVTNDHAPGTQLPGGRVAAASVEQAIRSFRLLMKRTPDAMANAVNELRGKDLACWCQLDQPCHADVLLVIANETKTPREQPEERI